MNQKTNISSRVYTFFFTLICIYLQIFYFPTKKTHQTPDINEVLIAEIAKRPQIYDSSLCPKNKNQIRRELWVEIFHVMNELIPLDKLPKVWKNIRDRYHKIKKDIERGSQTKPKYRYFEMLQFLDSIENTTIKTEKRYIFIYI